MHDREVFDQTWARMAKAGKCDELGGAEYQRAWAAWCASARVEAIEGLIGHVASMTAAGLKPAEAPASSPPASSPPASSPPASSPPASSPPAKTSRH